MSPDVLHREGPCPCLSCENVRLRDIITKLMAWVDHQSWCNANPDNRFPDGDDCDCELGKLLMEI